MIDEGVLTVSEQETARRQAIRALRKRLELNKPNPEDYTAASDAPVASKLVAQVLHWSRVGIVFVALAMLVASAIRNITAVYENYTASGSPPPIAALAAATFVVGVEFAIFVLALDQEGRNMRRKAERSPRHVANLSDLVYGIRVRLGAALPRQWHEMPERDGLTVVIVLAFAFAVIANIGVAMMPQFLETGLTLHNFLTSIPTLPAAEQWRFIENLAIALLPPAIALIGGHITARNAAAYAEQSQEAKAQLESDLRAWREKWRDPLADVEGNEYLDALLDEKGRRKLARKASKATNQNGTKPHPLAEAQ